MRKAEIVVSLLLLAVGALVVVDSVRLGFGWGPSGPKSGFFPFYLGVGIIVCALIVMVKVLRALAKDGPGKPLMPKGALKPILWVVIPSTAMVVASELVGLHVAAALTLAFYMRYVGKIGWVTTLAVSLLVPVSLYIAFDKLFMVPLPQGLWGAKLIPF